MPFVVSDLIRTLPGVRWLRGLLANRRTKLKFKGRSTEEIFTSIYSSNLWGSDVSRSGHGSDDVQTRVIIREFPKLLRAIGARSLLDVPCGDLHWMSRIDLGDVDYIGGDIVAAIIEENRKVHGSPRRRFEQLDLIKKPLPRADAVLVRDCLVHLPFRDALRAIANIQSSGAAWLITTTFLERSSNQDIPTGDWRPLNLQKAPFNFPTPSHLIVEECTENGGKYADKALAAWRVADLPKIEGLKA